MKVILEVKININTIRQIILIRYYEWPCTYTYYNVPTQLKLTLLFLKISYTKVLGV